MLNDAPTIAALKEQARRRVPKMFFDSADSGSFAEGIYRATESDFEKIKLRQRVLVDVTDRDLMSRMAGEDVAMPVALAPTGLTGMQHADGEMLAARAAEAFGVPFALSTMSIRSIEDVWSVTTRPFWSQLYAMRDRDFIQNLIDRAKAAGCSALVLTLDPRILGQRHKDLRDGLSAPPKFTPKHVWQMATRPGGASTGSAPGAPPRAPRPARQPFFVVAARSGDQHGAEIVDVGAGGAGDDQVAQGREEAIGVVVREQRGR